MYNVRDMSWMLKPMSIYQRDNKEIVEYNFITSCLAFWGSIPTNMSHIEGINIYIYIYHHLSYLIVGWIYDR